VPDVVLDIQRSVGRADQGHAGGEGIDTLAEWEGAALPRMRGCKDVVSLGKPGARAVQLPAFLTRVILGKTRAAGEQQAEKQGQYAGGDRTGHQ